MASNPYSGLSSYADKYYKNTNNAVNTYYNSAKTNITNDTNQQVKEYQQKKVQADKDAFRDARAANADYLKSINPYGYNAEKQASSGLGRSGFSESSKSANFTTAQNRISQARTTAEQAKMNFDNQIAQAYNTKNSKLAELAYNTMNTRNKALDTLLSRKIGIASGLKDWYLGKGNLDLNREEFKFRKSQA